MTNMKIEKMILLTMENYFTEELDDFEFDDINDKKSVKLNVGDDINKQMISIFLANQLSPSSLKR